MDSRGVSVLSMKGGREKVRGLGKGGNVKT